MRVGYRRSRTEEKRARGVITYRRMSVELVARRDLHVGGREWIDKPVFVSV